MTTQPAASEESDGSTHHTVQIVLPSISFALGFIVLVTCVVYKYKKEQSRDDEMRKNIEEAKSDFLSQASKNLFEARGGGGGDDGWATHQHDVVSKLPTLQREDAEAQLVLQGVQCFLLRSKSLSEVVVSAHTPNRSCAHTIMKLDKVQVSWTTEDGVLLAPDLSAAALRLLSKRGWSNPHILLDGKATSCESLYSLYASMGTAAGKSSQRSHYDAPPPGASQGVYAEPAAAHDYAAPAAHDYAEQADGGDYDEPPPMGEGEDLFRMEALPMDGADKNGTAGRRSKGKKAKPTRHSKHAISLRPAETGGMMLNPLSAHRSISTESSM